MRKTIILLVCGALVGASASIAAFVYSLWGDYQRDYERKNRDGY